MSEEPSAPALAGAPDRLTAAERRRVARTALVPVVVAAVALTPVAVMTTATATDVVGAVVLYGGLLGLAAGFVAVSRLQARQCPACHRRHDRGTARCVCGYDLQERPRYTCPRRHGIYLGPGTCQCGETLGRLRTARGIGSQVMVALRFGGWLLAFLVVAAVVVYLLQGRL